MAQAPSYMRGLLDDGQTPFNPGIPPGLLQFAAQPGRPAAPMAQNMMAAQGGGAPAPAPAAPPPAPMPNPAPPQSVGATGSLATDNALLAGGIGAMRAARPGGGGGSLGAALGEGLASGSLTFKATKDAEADREMALAAQADYAKRIRGLGLDKSTTEGLIGMGPAAGSKLLAEMGVDIAKKQAEPYTLSRGEQRRQGNQIIAENVEPYKPFDPAKMSSNMRDAFQTVLKRDIRDGDAFGAPLTDEEAARVNAHNEKMAELRRNLTSITNIPPGQKAGIEKGYELALESLNEEFNEVRTLPERIQLYDDLLDSVRSKGYKSGALADVRQAASKLARLAGLPVDLDSITNTDVMLSRLREAALLELKRLDARPTDKDMEVLLQKIGSLGTDPAALEQIFLDNQRDAKRRLAAYDRRFRAQNDQFKDYAELPAYLRPPRAPDTDKELAPFGVQPRNIFGGN
jgi:hypothetical protein